MSGVTHGRDSPSAAKMELSASSAADMELMASAGGLNSRSAALADDNSRCAALGVPITPDAQRSPCLSSRFSALGVGTSLILQICCAGREAGSNDSVFTVLGKPRYRLALDLLRSPNPGSAQLQICRIRKNATTRNSIYTVLEQACVRQALWAGSPCGYRLNGVAARAGAVLGPVRCSGRAPSLR